MRGWLVGIRGVLISRLRVLILSYLCVVGVFGCSSKPSVNYTKTDLQQLSYQWIQMGDVERRNHKYTSAIVYYKRGIKYARQRHDLHTVANTQLKIALCFLSLKDSSSANEYLERAEGLDRFESLNISVAINNVRAHIELSKSSPQTAKNFWLKNIQNRNLDDEQKIYYELKIMGLQLEQVMPQQLERPIKVLQEKYRVGTLKNVEILGFALLTELQIYLRVENINNLNFKDRESKISSAIAHFSGLEQTGKLLEVYSMAAEFYRDTADKHRANHFDQLISQLVK